ncbi:acetyl-CoA C-acetyltransferase [Streptomyces canus]
MSSATTSVIVAGARTPMGRLLGSLKSFSGAELGGFAIKAALDRAGIGGDQVQYVIMGQVLQAGAGQIPARQAAVKAGIPMNVPALTVNKVCLSGLDAIALADQLIRAGEFDVIVAGGQESMTNAPHLLPKSREGFKYGAIEMLDAMAYDGLTDAFENIAMGESTEKHNTRLGIRRPEQDEFSALSHQRAAAAQKNGIFEAEITPVEIPQRKGEPVVFSKDEGIRGDTTAESLGKLRPAFTRDGTITAGSASQISDGAAAVVVMSKAKAQELGLEWIAEIGAHGNVAGPDNSLQSQPSNAILARPQEGGPGGLRPRPDRDQRGLRRGRRPVDEGPRRIHRKGERERRSDRPRPPHRHVRRPARPAPRPGAQAARRRCRRGGPVRRRRSG